MYAHALVAAPRLALGWLAPLGRLLATPGVGMTGIFFVAASVLPDCYPLDDDLGAYVDAEHRVCRPLDVGAICVGSNSSMTGRQARAASRA